MKLGSGNQGRLKAHREKGPGAGRAVEPEELKMPRAPNAGIHLHPRLCLPGAEVRVPRAQRGSELLEAAAVPRAAQVGTEQVH